MMALGELLRHITRVPPGAAEVRIAGLTQDSREVRPGDLFLALPGRRAHGLAFAAEAAARGARAILWEPIAEGSGGADRDGPGASLPLLPSSVFAAPVAGLSQLVGPIADRFFGEPSAAVRVVGITGTNGKTTCAWLLAQCLERLAVPKAAGYIGTLGYGRIGTLGCGRVGTAAPAGAVPAGGAAALEPLAHTTPDAVRVHGMLARLKDAGVEVVAMEVSSHALDQGRVDGVRFHSAAFTNLTRDHLDYHATMEAYGEAKARLFGWPGLERAVIHVGDAFGRELARTVPPARLTAVWVAEPSGDGTGGPPGGGLGGPRGAATLLARSVTVDLKGLTLELDGSFGQARIETPLLGRFNAENVLIVTGCLLALGVSLDEAVRALAGARAAPGRMEIVDAGTPGRPQAVVDYAHTPDALAKALRALREHCRGALWCVFGCGGDRDRGKRPLMGAIADGLADRLIVTDDNPRSESPERIVADIVAGFRVHAPRVIHDRARAIATALAEAGANDLVLIAGKGHEDYQIYGTTRRRFSDRDEALRSLGVAA